MTAIIAATKAEPAHGELGKTSSASRTKSRDFYAEPSDPARRELRMMYTTVGHWHHLRPYHRRRSYIGDKRLEQNMWIQDEMGAMIFNQHRCTLVDCL